MSLQYNPNVLLTPAQICVALINHDNQKGYDIADLNFKAPVVLTDDPTGKNTRVETDLLVDPSEVDGDFVSFTYNRIDLANAFSVAVANGLNNFREIEVKEDGQLVNTKVISEILRKYSVAINETDFEITMPTASTVKVKAKVDNLAWIGEANFTIDSSLATRIAIKDMDEFATVAVAPVFTVKEVTRVAKAVEGFTSVTQFVLRADTNFTATLEVDANGQKATQSVTATMGEELIYEVGCDDTAEIAWVATTTNANGTVSKNGTIEAVV